MIIREGEPEDLDEIIQVLKLSLGEDDFPLSKEIWNYKHNLNPFGKSLVLVGIENDKIIGVRAFMAWEWQIRESVYMAYRAVDTATHPNHQGKGVFKKLTQAAVKVAKDKGISLIYNTPNDQSRPGYLKMGWEIVGKIEVALKPNLGAFSLKSKRRKDYEIIDKYSQNKQLVTLWNKMQVEKKLSFTPKSSEFLYWRYENNPLQQYEIYKSDKVYLAGYIKKRKNIRELRISESLYLNSNGLKELKKILKTWCKKFNAHIITYSPNHLVFDLPYLRGDFGPILTFRYLNLSEKNYKKFKGIKNWNNSIGDLELF
ncbi:GNAT family N-acetyltransferase [Gramella sp. AN32]|uniref:GNAT family N-acetyltransferase n=1 Tax=Christiangramia antarctica TaxID=2058158 RepID=A0ABW5X280_9FLAO|nr:GNAT family N-acetyltransferase [Gramella sp. AN32]MCM4157108.1 hypothetical protein [Gramella sp. AN32]